MKFSVIIPTYNRTRVLMDRAVSSVIAQTVSDWECLVVGDGTEEETVVEMTDLTERDNRFKFWNLPHYPYPDDWENKWGLLGLASLNFALDNAQGEWIAVLNDDDEWTPDHLEILYTEALTSGADHVYGMADTYKNGQSVNQFYGAWPPGIAQFCNGANIYRAALGYRYDLRCREKGLNGDEDLWTRMISDGVKFHFVPRLVLHYHRNYP